MSEQKPFRPSVAKEARSDASEGDVLLPLMMPKPDLMMGERMAIVILTTVEDQKVGIPMGHQGVSDLYEISGEALRMLQAPEGGSVQ
ncbi:hypothetical protein [Methylobacterium sp. Leaf89]|uniref:hypothetical protein n=1 Tax=Methylobacterium sp. Leaf89 TaxID=1736245 RepID=UPI0006F54798|nr:hypothetical protein [Methylobacterium sp. Leaf89]KQO68004.1 hypothetical protein ASF18_05955 [Methylobacterium sp. Leaf89]